MKIFTFDYAIGPLLDEVLYKRCEFSEAELPCYGFYLR